MAGNWLWMVVCNWSCGYHNLMCVLGQVVRLCAKSRESVASSVEFLTLHYLVNNSH